MIVLQDLRKRYGGREILSGITVTLETGRVYAIAGPSGSGKTTLLQILAGYEHPTSGAVQVSNTLRLEYAPQDFLLFSTLTVWHHMRLKAAARRLQERWEERAHRLLADLGIANHCRARVGMLSGGERRRLQLAIALLPPSDVLLLDEPTSNLDAMASEQVWETLAREGAGKTMVICSHAPIPSQFEPVRWQLRGGVLDVE
ncbi:ABC transporter ATP-binding protein [Alicyclobacillus mali]|uniref:ABC transporter ATP-binding protein n=1 Tax=Alicyclobacillus mali (ex Roth et al. 2021) TaxID=1123961 RepID=A0ABS0F5P9_9BACL|nr:ABC transporter ATP-binding protein [Alicyclobacillus mali (ex Roth et al. 2021)]MBF8378641.1 ABC transporter ATP-binding protein [Alicyclobacillus mali (ex Roth et al. 2021)]MCL6489998.1 ABC transporter ATP-binding protein [Alicyclobacillus mali (ex Roth et al. 2021)]